jgi:hypothetical protein
MPKQERFSVITADIVGSREVESFRLKRDKTLKQISDLHLREKLIVSRYAVTAWDEFQTILTEPEHTPRVMLDLRRFFYPSHLWIAVGVGLVSEARKTPINRFAGGQAFERARLAVERLSKNSPKFRILSSFESGVAEFDSVANTVYHLHDTLIEGTTAKQWETINTLINSTGQDDAAQKLSVGVSTVSRTLKRAHYWHMIETVDTMEALFRKNFPIARISTNP